MAKDPKRKYVPIRKEKTKPFLPFFSPLVYSKTKCLSKGCGLPRIDPRDTEGRLRPLLSIGLWFLGLLRRLLLPGIGVVHAAGKDKGKEKECDPSRKLVRACDLPIYGEEEKKCLECATSEPPEDTIFTETIKCARKELWFFMEQTQIVKKEVRLCLQSFKDQSEDMLCYLREESNVAPRMGAIAIGGLSGYILALRRGFFRRLMYSSAGAAAMAALCYPNEAKEYSQEGFKTIKNYAIIGYHFLNGDDGDNAECDKNKNEPIKADSKECDKAVKKDSKESKKADKKESNKKESKSNEPKCKKHS